MSLEFEEYLRRLFLLAQEVGQVLMHTVNIFLLKLLWRITCL